MSAAILPDISFTRYDWAPGKRWLLLQAIGDSEPRHMISCWVRPEVVYELAELGMLIGQAKEDVKPPKRGAA